MLSPESQSTTLAGTTKDRNPGMAQESRLLEKSLTSMQVRQQGGMLLVWTRMTSLREPKIIRKEIAMAKTDVDVPRVNVTAGVWPSCVLPQDQCMI